MPCEKHTAKFLCVNIWLGDAQGQYPQHCHRWQQWHPQGRLESSGSGRHWNRTSGVGSGRGCGERIPSKVLTSNEAQSAAALLPSCCLESRGPLPVTLCDRPEILKNSDPVSQQSLSRDLTLTMIETKLPYVFSKGIDVFTDSLSAYLWFLVSFKIMINRRKAIGQNIKVICQ
jgi:hypothetical protein